MEYYRYADRIWNVRA